MLEVELTTNKSRWILGLGVLVVTGLVCPLRGDARDDLSRANSDYNALSGCKTRGTGAIWHPPCKYV
jgi:hypothetical protein